MTARFPVHLVFLVCCILLAACKHFEPAGYLKVETVEVVALGSYACSVKGLVEDTEDSRPFFGMEISTDPENLGYWASYSIMGFHGEFIYDITGLEPDTDYYIRAFASNDKGEALGEVLQIHTPADRATGEGVAFSGMSWVQWEIEPLHVAQNGYAAVPYERPWYNAPLISGDWSMDRILDAESFDNHWASLWNIQYCTKKVEEFGEGHPSDVGRETLDPAYGTEWAAVHDGSRLYVFMKFYDRDGIIPPGGRQFDIMDQPTSIYRHEATFLAALDSSADMRMICENMAYGRYLELGGGKAVLHDGIVTEYGSCRGLHREKVEWKSYMSSNDWATNEKGYAAYQQERHFWDEDAEGTIRAVLVLPFATVLAYPVDPTNLVASWVPARTGQTISFDVLGAGILNPDVLQERYTYYWAAESNNGYTSNYYSGLLYLSAEEFEFMWIN